MTSSSLGKRYALDTDGSTMSSSKRTKISAADNSRASQRSELQGSRAQLRQECELKLQTTKRTYGDMHPETFKITYSLANAYLEHGLFRMAATLQRQALSRQIEMFGSNHLDTVQGMHELARTYLKQKLFERAEKLQLRVVSVRRQVLGRLSVETLWANHQLVKILYKQGRLKEAQALDRETCELGQKSTSESNRQTMDLNLPPSVFQDQSFTSDFESHVRVALDEAMLTIPCLQPTNNNCDSDSSESSTSAYSLISQDRISERLAVQTERCIGTKTSMKDVLKLLVKAQCRDLTEQINSSQCPKAPHAGGRFGDVWRGELLDQTKVAIKCLRLHTASDDSVKNVKRAARELYYWSKAKHRNVLELTGIGIFKGRLAMISPWMTNGTLHTYIFQHPEVNRWSLCEDVVEGLAYIHELGMVHGDLKAVNILVSGEGVVKLSDFGNAILSDHSLAFTATTNVGGGTSRWMAPELLQEEDEVGESPDRSMPADVYALGMTILEVVTGEPPYAERKTDAWVIQAVTEGQLPYRPVYFQSDVRGDERWALLEECWSPRPRDRPTAMMVKHQVHALA